MKQSERLVLLEENKQEIERLNTELQRRKGIVSDLLDGCNHTDGNGDRLTDETFTQEEAISMRVKSCKICGALLELSTSIFTSMFERV
ncbi:hypothetical protein DFP93_101304 [Aneurinibacillus soli]|uniref:Uncharacterized protein n=1 Tax=Aneurinibacillus soli TaxID=1500254 RepID=A0A0U5C7L8_9BACL|nr:hypothetical protein [Aneurinibacillus soli]PYE64278.1 hypothetical protein DFP93_101304 [Aneurinibacillus soli]BAU28227.1 hypothetical protein CB4_02401 [Aneurinibacillus soli]